ncbi:MAG: branched-chain amino acid transport system permease protein livM [Acidimicrobiaceae bacterium]
MTTFLTYTIIGLVVGAVYSIAASGLVLTYTTSGIFNFAHGAIGMVSAFSYWELRVHRGWPAPLALLVVIVVLAPLMGLVIERSVVRRLRGASVEVTLVVTLGLLLALLNLSYYVWDPTLGRPLPRFFDGSKVRLLDVNISYHQLIVLAVGCVVAIGLRLLLGRTRVGLAMRAVVDDSDLLAMNAGDPERVTAFSWALGAALAALAGVLIAPLVTLDALSLTLLVVNAYAAAVIGRLRSLPLTFAGGLGLGLVVTYATGYFPQTESWDRLAAGVPTIALFIVLIFLPPAGVARAQASSRRVPGLPSTVAVTASAIAFAAATVVVARGATLSNLISLGDVLGFGIILLSLVLLTGFGGQVSLCQLTFAGIGALAVGKVGANPLGFLVAACGAGAVGALVALPAVRLRGLYLALVTLAFARFADVVVFPNSAAFGSGDRLAVDRFELGPVSFAGERIYFVLLGVVFAATAAGLLTLRRSSFGRRLSAMSDSPAACATVGIDVTRTKLAVFAISAAMAGVGGGLFGGLHTGVSANDFTMLGSLTLLLLVVLGGIGHVSGAILGSATLGVIAAIKPGVAEPVQRILDLAPGVVVMLVLASVPDGVAGWWGQRVESIRAWRRSDLRSPTQEARTDVQLVG